MNSGMENLFLILVQAFNDTTGTQKMSYKQIYRRAKRVLKSTINDAVDSISSEKKELDDFEEELKKSSFQKEGERSQTKRDGQSHRRHRSGEQQRAKQKPGEKSDGEYLKILGLTPGVSNQEISAAYKKLISQYHPDRVASLGPELHELASRKTKEINEAYQMLKKRRGM